ncbi:MAG: Mur ligase family protein, partial [Acutalibacteraceae bacterium]
MMTAWQYLILNILLVFQTAFSLTREYQLLQQNSYYNSRYFENYTHKLNVNSIIKILDFAVKTLLFFALKNFVLCAVYFTVSAIATFLIQRNIQKKSIKPLVFTARIKRMYFTAFLFMLLLCAADFCILNNGIVIGALALLCLLAFVFCPVVNIINKPIEKAVAGYFINDAKRILKARGNMKIIGITGSFGKTSTKHILYRILSEKYNVFMTPGGINTPLGIVKTVREQLPNDTQIFICEMGAKNIGDIKEICDIVHPDIGVVTTVGAMHLNTFKTVENVKKTKLELADAVSEKHGRIFLNGDNEYLNTEKDKYSAVTFGINNNNDYRAENIYYDKNGSSFVLCTKDEKRIELKTKLLGINNVSNILSALSVAAELGICDS